MGSEGRLTGIQDQEVIYVCILSCVGAATTLVILMDTSRGTTEVRYLDGLKLYRDWGPCPTRFITIPRGYCKPDSLHTSDVTICLWFTLYR